MVSLPTPENSERVQLLAQTEDCDTDASLLDDHDELLANENRDFVFTTRSQHSRSPFKQTRRIPWSAVVISCGLLSVAGFVVIIDRSTTQQRHRGHVDDPDQVATALSGSGVLERAESRSNETKNETLAELSAAIENQAREKGSHEHYNNSSRASAHQHDKNISSSAVATTTSTTCAPIVGACRDAVPGDPCYTDATWAMHHGIIEHPEWYEGLTRDSTLVDFQDNLHKQRKACCPKPCTAVTVLDPAVVAMNKKLASGPVAQTFYMYRAQSDQAYPLENINTADLAGVMWYLHNEVIPATPRKYAVDRIRRYKVTVKNTHEFWNVHRHQFGPFMAFDAGRCSTPICESMYHSYGFIVGCQMQDTEIAAYTNFHRTTWSCKKGSDACNAPLWFSLPGPCPSQGLQNNDIAGNSDHIDVRSAKSTECVAKMPGGYCSSPDGGPACTYSYEEAGEIFLDELAGIPDYDEFWKGSYNRCLNNRNNGSLPKDTKCVQNKEYDGHLDKGVGCNFWNGKHDKGLCTARMNAVRSLFKKHFPQWPESLPEPLCDFDTFYDNELTWPVNHTGAPKSAWWDQRMRVEHHSHHHR